MFRFVFFIKMSQGSVGSYKLLVGPSPHQRPTGSEDKPTMEITLNHDCVPSMEITLPWHRDRQICCKNSTAILGTVP